MTDKIAALRELLAKVEADEEGLSFSLGRHVDAWPDDMWNGDSITLGTVNRAHHGSMDAAQRLHEAALPSWKVTRIGQPEMRSEAWLVQIRQAGPDSFHRSEAVSRHTPARAWLIAILKARIIEEEK